MSRALVLCVAVCVGSALQADPLAAISHEPVSLEVNDAGLREVLQILSPKAGVSLSPTECAARKRLTLRLKKAPVDVVLRSIADELHLVLGSRGEGVTVACADEGAHAEAPNAAPGLAPQALPVATVGADALRAENARLKAELEQARGTIEKQRKELEAELGSAPRAPANLDPRFASGALLANVSQALREAGFTGAQVTSIDCSEYPCIVYGDGFNARDDTDKLKKTQALAPYTSDRMSTFGWGSGADKQMPHWGLTVVPSDDPTPHADMLKRLRYRAAQMSNATSADGK